MNILFINNEFPPIGGGGSILTSYLAENLVRLKHKIIVITSSYNNLPREETIKGYKILRVPAIRKRKDVSSYLELISFFVSSLIFTHKLIKKFKPDLIHSFFSVPSGGTAMILSKIYKIPYAVYLGGSDVPGANLTRHKNIYPFITPLINFILKKASFVSACSDVLVSLVKKHLPRLKIVKIPNGVDFRYFTPPKEKPSTSALTILGVGRIMPRKGFQFLVDALGKIKNRTKKRVKVILIGSGDYRRFLQDLAIKLKVNDMIKFIDSVPYKDLKYYYQSSHIFCLPSLAEGMPLAMIEAMACGCALLTTDVAGNQELVANNKNGYLVKPGNSKELADKLLELINNPKEILIMGKNSRKLSKKYDWRIITNAYLKNYQKIIR